MFEFEKSTYKQEINELIKKSTPIEVDDLALTRIESDISWGSFYFYFKDKEQNESSINLTPYCSDIYLVLAFLWQLNNINTPLLSDIEDEGETGFFYAEKVSETQIRFLVFEDYELYRKWVKDRIDDYSFADAHICLDIIIDKNKLIQQFYIKLWNEIKNWKNVEYVNWGNKIDKRCEKFIYKLNKSVGITEEHIIRDNKTKSVTKMLLFILGTIVLFVLGVALVLIIFINTMFQDLNIKESDVRNQISLEMVALNDYKPILNYIEEYKAKNGGFPRELPKSLTNIQSEKFEGFKYELTKYGGYLLQIYPKYGPIEYYQPKNLCYWRKQDDGMEDGVLDNEYYYKVNDDWQAIHFQYYTRYRK